MNRFSKATMFLIFVGMFFVFYNLQLKKQSSIALCQANALTAIRIQHDGTLLQLGKGDEHWLIDDAGQNFIADNGAIEAYRRFVCYMPFVEIFDFPDESPESLKNKYGITEASVITVTGSSVSEKLYVGKLTPAGTEFYLYNPKQPQRIYTAPNSYVENLFPETVGLIFRFPFLELPSLTQLQIDYQGQQWQLRRDENGFYFADDKLSRDLAQAFVTNLYETYFVNYKGQLPANDLVNYQPEFYDLMITYIDPASQQEKRWLLFQVNDIYHLLMSFGGEPYLLLLDSAKMLNLENLLLQMTKS